MLHVLYSIMTCEPSKRAI